MSVSASLRKRVRQQAGDRCGYCQSSQRYVLGQLEIDHIIPTGRSGTDDEANLWLACRLCNNHKGLQTHAKDPLTQHPVSLFNPRTQIWSEHFDWSADGTHIIGKSATGRATVVALQLNNPIAVMVRQAWVSAGWHPPKD